MDGVENACENGKLGGGFAHVIKRFRGSKYAWQTSNGTVIRRSNPSTCSICDKWRLARRSLHIREATTGSCQPAAKPLRATPVVLRWRVSNRKGKRVVSLLTEGRSASVGQGAVQPLDGHVMFEYFVQSTRSSSNFRPLASSKPFFPQTNRRYGNWVSS
jgi:hypothetical protein